MGGGGIGNVPRNTRTETLVGWIQIFRQRKMGNGMNIIRRARSTTIRRHKLRVLKALSKKKNNKVEVVDIARNSLTAVNNQDADQITNTHQLRSAKSNPTARTTLSKKKMKRLRKRLVLRDAASGALKRLVDAAFMDTQ